MELAAPSAAAAAPEATGKVFFLGDGLAAILYNAAILGWFRSGTNAAKECKSIRGCIP